MSGWKAAGLLSIALALTPQLLTFECCGASDAGSNRLPMRSFGFVPIIGWFQFPFATYAGLAVGTLAFGFFATYRLVARLCCTKLYRKILCRGLVGVFLASLSTAPLGMAGEEIAKFAGGRNLQLMFRYYIHPGFASEDDVLNKIRAAEYFDSQGDTKIIMPGSVPLLNDSQVARALDGIERLRPMWKHIDTEAGPLPMFTLGHASYLHRNRPHLNPALYEEFEWLYEIILDAIQARMGAPAKMKEGANAPGFHLFLSSAVWGLPVATVHSDLQYAAQFTGNSKLGEIQVISFTLPLRLPAVGYAGLYTFTSTPTHSGKKSRVKTFEAGFVREFHPYTVGELVIHGGVLNHQIAPSTMVIPGDGRVTLQGHGYWSKEEEAWILYW